MEVEPHADVPDGWHVVTPTAATAAPTTAFGLQIKPEIVAAANEIDKRQAADAERDKNWPADMASKLPRALQAPVAEGLSMIQPATEIAGVLAGAPSALRAGRAASDLLSHPADVLIDTLLKKIGHDPDALELAATKMKLQAARSQTRQGRIAADIAAKTAAPPPPTASSAPVVAPGAAAPAAPAPVVAAPAPQGELVRPPSAPPSPAASAPIPPAPAPAGPPAAANTLPNQKALNEAALAIRRQAYQQRLQASQVAAEAPVPAADAAGYVKPAPLTKEETVAFWDYIKRGMSGADAMKNVQLQRELATTLGTPTPTAAQTRFPKGMRGKVTSQP